MKYPSGHVALERALSKLGLASRSEGRRLIRDGGVIVNGRAETNPLAAVRPERDAIALQGRAPAPRAWRTIAFYKPRGTMTTRRDPDGRRTVFDVLGPAGDGLIAVGRLDYATSGLLLLTTDTQLAERLTHPRHGVVRRYAVSVRGEVRDEDRAALERGIAGPSTGPESPRGLSSDVLRASAVTIRKRSRRETHLLVELTEGKNREIRRLFDAIGRPVTRLLRIAYGPIELGRLQPGEWREVTHDELSRR
jgi:23S rRNA pseudouridine2605 synthase